MKKKILTIVIAIVVSSNLMEAEILHTFISSVLQVNCGQASFTGYVYLRQEEDVNEPFAVSLNWPIESGHRVFEKTWHNVTVSGLNTSVHARGNGGGYNRKGKKVEIYRSGEPGNFTYQQWEETYYDNKPCVHNELE